ncbi:MAG TPA: hypothetical protein VFT56_16080 [Sphingomonas sp.]|nr:hypothetical protein [Sphingomonas sp.]
MLSALSTILMAMQAAAPTPAESPQNTSTPAPMKCEVGPAHRTLGGTQWIVYSCDDQASMVVVSAQGNPASPFYFFLKPAGGAYSVSGEGNGNKEASDAAGDALAKMTPAEFAALLAETKGNAR